MNIWQNSVSVHWMNWSGRTDLLKVKDVPTSERASTLNLEQILDNPYEGKKTPMTFNPKKVFDFELKRHWMKKFW